MKILSVDVRKPHLNAEGDEEAYVELPKEAETPRKCVLLRRRLYGMRGAAQGWERHYSKKLLEARFVQRKSWTVAFFYKARCVRLAVHGNGFTWGR